MKKGRFSRYYLLLSLPVLIALVGLVWGRPASTPILFSLASLSGRYVSAETAYDGSKARLKTANLSMIPADGVNTYGEVQATENPPIVATRDGSVRVEGDGQPIQVAKGQATRLFPKSRLARAAAISGGGDEDSPWTPLWTWELVRAPRHNPGGLLFCAPIRPIIGRGFSPLPLWCIQVVELPPCSVPGQVVSADLSTGTTNSTGNTSGVKIPLGSADPKWHVISLPVLGGESPAYSMNPTLPPPALPWVPNTTQAANWIQYSNIFSPGHGPNMDASGPFTYEVLFRLDFALYSSIGISGRFGVQHEGNPSLTTYLGPGGNYAAWTTFTIAATPPGAPFQDDGLNSLEFKVNQTFLIDYEGLIVDAKLQARCLGGGGPP